MSTRTTTQITIAQAAERSGLSAHTLRYYERIGLIHPVGRGENGHRRYGRDDLEWLELLTKLRTTDMPIRQMVQYAELVREGPHTAARRRAMLEDHRDAVHAQMTALEEIAAVLDHKISMYTEMENNT
ncbi:MAG: MerR family transcriptional regulator [Thermoleophilaceae bacterium]|nr:MerR family transcriptional regulator [Thermoleophilaceae bacterium]